MVAPLTREQQIEFMQNAEERHNDLVDKWVSDKGVREVLARPAKGQSKDSAYLEEEKVMACCG